MTALLLALVVIQAAFLLWSSVNLSDIFLQQKKGTQFLRFVATFIFPAAIAWYGERMDPHRLLCGLGDCLAIAVSVGFIRLWAVNKEEEQLAVERALAVSAAAEAVETARRSLAEEKIMQAAAALENPRARITPLVPNPIRRSGARSPGSAKDPGKQP